MTHRHQFLVLSAFPAQYQELVTRACLVVASGFTCLSGLGSWTNGSDALETEAVAVGLASLPSERQALQLRELITQTLANQDEEAAWVATMRIEGGVFNLRLLTLLSGRTGA